MTQKRATGNVSRHHLYLGAGGILAAVALVTAVAFGFAKAETMDPAAQCAASGGTWNASNNPPCTMPAGSGGSGVCPSGYTGTYPNCQPSQMTCPNGSSHPSPYTCQGAENCSGNMTWNGTACAAPVQNNVACPNGSSHPSGYVCTQSENCPSNMPWNGTACASTTGSGSGVTCGNGSVHSAGYVCTSAESCGTGMTWNGTMCTGTGTGAGNCPSGMMWNGTMCVSAQMRACVGAEVPTSANPCLPSGSNTGASACTSAQYWNGTSCVTGTMRQCNPGEIPTGTNICMPAGMPAGGCTGGQYWNGTSCVNSSTIRACVGAEVPTAANPCMPSGANMGAGACTSGQYWNGTACVSNTSGGLVTCPSLGGRQVTPEECGAATPVCGPNQQPSATTPCKPSTTPGAGACTSGQYWNGTACVSNTNMPRQCGPNEQPTPQNPCMPSGMPAGGCTGGQYWNGTSCVSNTSMRQCGPNEMPTPQNPCMMSNTATQFNGPRACPALPSNSYSCSNGFNFDNNGCPLGCRTEAIKDCPAGVMPSPQNPCRPTSFFFPMPFNQQQGQFPGMNGQQQGQNQFQGQGFQQGFVPPAPCAEGQMPSPQKPCIPNFDFSHGVPTFGNFDPSKQFEQFNKGFEFNFDAQQNPASNVPPANMVARQAKDLVRQLDQASKEINRQTSRAANLTTCPGVTEALAFSQNAQDRSAKLQVAVTEANKAEIWALIQDTQGGPGSSSEDSFFGKMGQIMPKIGMCEGATHLVKELSRCEKDLTRLAKGADGEALKAVQEKLSSVAAWKADPFQGVDFDSFDPQDFMDKMDELCGSGVDDVRQAINDQSESSNVCGHLKDTQEEIQGMLDGTSLPKGFPKSALPKAKQLAPKALAIIEGALAANSADACFEASQELDDIGQQIMSGTGRAGTFQIDQNDLLKQQVSDALSNGEDIDALVERITNDIVGKVQKNIELIANKVFTDMATKLASAGLKLDNATQLAMNNLTGLNKDTLNKVLSNRDEISQITSEAAPLVTAKFASQFQGVVSKTLQYNFSQDASAELKSKFDSFSNFLAAGPKTDEVKTELDSLQKAVDTLRNDPKEVASQFKAGYIPFKDSGDPSQFFFDDISSLKEAGVIKGTGNSQGTQVEPGKQVNLAEASAMFVRGLNLGDKFDSKPNSVKAQIPDWAKNEMGVLAAAGVSDVLNAKEDFRAPTDRGSFFTMQVHALAAAGVVLPDVTCVAGKVFTDVKCDDAGRAALQLHAMGIVNGFPDGSIKLDGDLNRAQAATLVGETLKSSAVREAIASEAAPTQQ